MGNQGSTVVGRARKARPVWVIAFVLALLGAFSLSLGTATRAFADPSNAGGVSIDAGGSGDGGAFAADEDYSGGSEGTNSSGSNGDITFSTVANTIPQADWNTYRYGSFTYTIPDLSVGGEYQVRLYFLDWQNTQTGQRIFDVNINGSPALENFDIVQAAGNAGGDGTYIGVEENFNETANASGDITIAFSSGSAGVPQVNAIAVAPVAVNAGGVSIDSGGTGDVASNVAGTSLSETGWTATSNTASSPGDTPQNAISGDTGARFSSDAHQAFGMYWEVNMGSAQSFDEVELDSGGFNQDYARAYEVQVSNNGTSFTTVYNGTGTGSPETANFAPQTAQYIRVVLEVGNNSYWWSLVNVLVYGSGAASSGFVADNYYSGGSEGTNTSGSNGFIDFANTVAHPIPQNDWNTFRYGTSTYVIPDLTPAASYQVRLYFLDWQNTQTGQRVFNVDINGTAVLSNFDIVQAAGNAGGDGTYIGVEENFNETADASGDITIQFLDGSAGVPQVNAIAVVPAA
jgi:Malectin domain/F5/8 type C domain